MVSKDQPGRGSGVRRPAWLLFFVALRLLVLLFSAELSGVTHAVLDVLADEGAHESEDCEEDGHECPPGCPGCHCWHAGAPTPPLPFTCEFKVVISQVAKFGFTPHADVPTQGADPDSVYRPPRLRSFRS